jgi:predicted  nucleic acid-binding Zn-ribbon protein
MSTQEERIAALEQAVTSLRGDLLQTVVDNTRSISAFNRVIVQQEQSTRDINHEITILTGVVGAQGRDIKEIKQGVVDLQQRFASLEGKLDQVLQLLTTKTDE